MSQSRSLKNILIMPSFQLKLMGYFGALFLLTTVSLYSTTYLFFWNMKEKGLNVGIPEGHVYYHFLQNQKEDLDLLFIALAGFNFLLLFTIGFIISHRIAGPLFKMKHFLEAESQEEKFKLREHDFFQEFVPLINRLKGKE